MRTLIVPFLAASVALAGCAKNSYVSREVGEVNKKVDAVAAEVEKTQQRVQRSEIRIEAVDKWAQSGIGEAKGSAQDAMTKAQEAEKAAKGKLIYSVTLSNDKVSFPVNQAEISEEAKAMVDGAVGPLSRRTGASGSRSRATPTTPATTRTTSGWARSGRRPCGITSRRPTASPCRASP